MSETRNSNPAPAQSRPRVPLPAGYRQGLISAITVVMGFSLLFLRYWSLEAPGVWSTASVAAAVLLVLAILAQLVALWRSLQVEDDDEPEYRKTLRWFFGSVFALFASLLLAALTASRVI